MGLVQYRMRSLKYILAYFRASLRSFTVSMSVLFPCEVACEST